MTFRAIRIEGMKPSPPTCNQRSLGRPVAAIALLARPVIEDHSLLKMWLQDIDESFVSRVGKVDIAILFAVEGDQKAVGQTIGQAFGAIVDAKLERADFGNLPRESSEGVDDRLNLLFRCPFLELEHHHVPQDLFIHRACLHLRGSDRHQGCHQDSSYRHPSDLFHDCFLFLLSAVSTPRIDGAFPN